MSDDDLSLGAPRLLRGLFDEGAAAAAGGDEHREAASDGSERSGASSDDDDEAAAVVNENIADRARALSDRSKHVRQLFLQDPADLDYWTCNVEVDAKTGRKCGQRVKQTRRNQSGNLAKHITNVHKSAVSVPTARKHTSKRVREAAGAAVAEAVVVAALPPAAAQAAAARNAAAEEEEVVDLFVRRSFAFALADDPFFAKRFSGGRQAMAKRIVEGLDVKLALLKRSLQGVEVVVISDAGTHHGKQSVDVVVQAHCIPTAIAVVYPNDTTAVTLQGHLQEAAAGFKVLAFVSDNAANFVAANSALAAMNRCFQSSCGAHSVQIVARSLLVPEFAAAIADVDALRDVVRRLAKDLPKIPVEVESRWNSTFLALNAAKKHWPQYFQRRLLTDEARARIHAAVEGLLPAYELTLELESDCATVYNNVSAFARLLLPFARTDKGVEAYRIFVRDVFSVPFVAACVINPTFKWSELPKWAFQSLLQLLTVAIDIATRCGEDIARGHAASWAGGVAQQRWILTGRPAHEFFANAPRNAAPIKALHDKLLMIPASSAAVERAFSIHTAIHSDARASLEHAGVESSLVLRSIKHRERADIKDPLTPPFPASEVVGKLAMWCARAAAARAIANAPIGSRITVFYEARGALEEHVGTIIGKPNATHVTVRWQRGEPSDIDFTEGEVFLGVA